MTAQENIWQAAELVEEWQSDEYRYKLYQVPREAIDEDSDEDDAYLLHGFDSGGVRRVDVLLDTAYSRTISDDDAEKVGAAYQTAPTTSTGILTRYC